MFQPGVAANPTGKTTRYTKLTRALKIALAADDGKRIRQIGERLAEAAAGGDMDAIEFVFNRVEGKPRETQDVNVNGTLTHESAGLSALADFVKQALAGRTAPVIEADVPERSLLPALLCPETPGSGK